jgi:hypothetical protein
MTVRKKALANVTENRMLRRTFGSGRQEVK